MKKLIIALLLAVLGAASASAQVVYGVNFTGPDALHSLPAGATLRIGSTLASVDANGNLTVNSCSGCGAGGGITLGTAGQLPVMNAGATAYAPVSLSLDATSTSTGALTVVGLKGSALPSLSVGYLNWTGAAWALSAVSGGSAFPITVTGGVSGAVPCFTSTTVESAGTLLAANGVVIGGGAGVCPSTTATGTGVVTALGVNTGSAGAFVVNGGALGTPSSGTLTSATGLPLTTGVTGILPAANGGTGVNNTATLTLGSSAQNWATLGTGLVKNTVTTGALSNGASADVYGLFTSCTGSSGLFLKDGGTCAAPGGSGTVSVVGAGTLTSTAFVTGGGTQLVQTPSATSTLSAGGNAFFAGTLAATGHVTFEGVTSTGATGAGLLVFNNGPTFIAPLLGTPASGVLTNATGYLWNNNANPTGSLSLTMGANTSTFNTTTAQAQMHAWKNTTAAVVGTSQGSPVLADCGRAFHASADVEDCLTLSELPGNGNDAAITFNIGHTGTSTGTVTTQFPGPMASGANGTNVGIVQLPGNTTNPTPVANAFSLYGPASASFTGYAWQPPTAENGSAGILHAGAAASHISALTISLVALATDVSGQLPVGSVGSAGLSGTAPVSVASTGVISLTGAAGQVPNGATGAFTATPTLGASGTLGSITFGNATSGLLTLQTATGAITSYTVDLPVVQPVGSNTFLSCTAANPAVCTWAAGGGGSSAFPITVTGGVSGAVPCFTSTTVESAGTLLAANAVVVGGGAGVCPSTISADSTTTHALFATAGAPAFRAIATGDLPTAIPIGNVGSAGLSGTAPVSVASTGVISLTGATGQVPNGATGAFTATPTLGASGTVGTISFGNATSGTVTLGTVAGALGAVTASLPANTGTIGELNLAQTWSALQTFGANASIAGTAHGVLLSQNTSAATATAVGATNTVLNGNTGADPSFGAVPIAAVGTSGLSGTAPATISAAGAIGCATCVTSAASLANGGVVLGTAGTQASATNTQLVFSGSTLTVGLGGTGTGILALGGVTSGTATITAPAVAGTITNAVTSSNNISAPAFASTVSTGTAPLVVASTTNVANLNASTLVGKAPVGTDAGVASAATISTTAGTIVCATATGGVTTTACPTGLPAVTNTTAVTVNNPTAATDTILMALAPAAGYFNIVGQPYIIHGSGVLTTTAASVPQVTITAKICSVAGCGSGTVTPLAAIQSTALNTTAVTNASWNYDLTMTVVANGASCNFIVKGSPGLVIETGAAVTAADSVFADGNTAVSSPNQNCANALFVDFFVQQSTTGASNSYKQLEAVVAPPSGVSQAGGGGTITGSAASNQAVNGTGATAIASGYTDTAGTITSGKLACYTASNTIGNCTGTPSNNIIGVFNSSTTWISSGETSVTLDATVSVTFGDILCASSTAGFSHDNGAVSCASGEWIGIVKTTAASVSSATAFVALR